MFLGYLWDFFIFNKELESETFICSVTKSPDISDTASQAQIRLLTPMNEHKLSAYKKMEKNHIFLDKPLIYSQENPNSTSIFIGLYSPMTQLRTIILVLQLFLVQIPYFR